MQRYFDSSVDVAAVLSSCPANDRPLLLCHLWLDGKVDREMMRAVLLDVWCSTDFPEQFSPKRLWVDWFRWAGFLSDKRTGAPTSPVTIFRGATWARRRGMAWTADREKAVSIARHFRTSGKEAFVFTATMTPERVLAIIDGRGDSEVVVDPRFLPPLRRKDAEKIGPDPEQEGDSDAR